MIHRIFSSLPGFKSIEFAPGLNLLLAQREVGATDRQTRNGTGKTSLIEIIHFLTGAKADKDSLFRHAPLAESSFGMEFDLGNATVRVERKGKKPARIELDSTVLTNSEWIDQLGHQMFGLHDVDQVEGRTPTFRSLFSYFVRREHNGAFAAPEKQAAMQQASDWQMALLYLMGLDWRIASDWQVVRDREKILAALKKAAGEGAFTHLVGTAADLRSRIALQDGQLRRLTAQLTTFRVLPEYRELEAEADQLTQRLASLANANVLDSATARDLEKAVQFETPPPLQDLQRIYAEAGIALPGVALQRYDEVMHFHQSVVRNRRSYLASELDAARRRIEARQSEAAGLDERRAAVLGMLNSHGALDQFSRLQAEAARQRAELEALRQRFAAAEQLEGAKNELEIERNQLALRLRRNFDEQSQRINEAYLAYEETSRRLYEAEGRMALDATSNGPVVRFIKQANASKGIGSMQIFCFDMMLMRLCAQRGTGPGFLVHDSHLFDGVDGRQVISALKLGAETASELGFQYIVTMNEDDAFKETIADFDLNHYALPVRLTDATEDGGLFGMRF